ncbi:MAG: radical SAM protein [candidate division NC10 bacterium]|nr:radical SAM protein [candidate division NC10 bacterium]
MVSPVYSVSWNLTQRCNLYCAHCYMSAFAGADASKEFSTEECRRVMDEIAQVNPNVFLILTGGEPLLRKDIFDLASYAAEKEFTVVLGTNGVLLKEKQARLMRRHGIQGASLSLDSTDPKKHDAFRHLPGAWQGAIRATKALKAEGLDFSIHTSVTSWNMEEIPGMIDLARALGARVLNFFFLVRTGRGQNLTDITPDQYEQILTYLARVQGVGDGPNNSSEEPSASDRPEDPWSVPVGRSGDLIIRAKCAPFFRRILYALDPDSPLLNNYAHGSCPAGKAYCRITPEGDVTPCPYMPVSSGNLRAKSFASIWHGATILNDLRDPQLGGRCGACEFARICGGCRCRAYATYGDYLAEDPACAYQPGGFGGKLITLSEERTFGLEARLTLEWTEAARERVKRLPSFARGMVIKGAERYAREQGIHVITPEVLQAVRERAEARFGRPFTFREFTRIALPPQPPPDQEE